MCVSVHWGDRGVCEWASFLESKGVEQQESQTGARLQKVLNVRLMSLTFYLADGEPLKDGFALGFVLHGGMWCAWR